MTDDPTLGKADGSPSPSQGSGQPMVFSGGPYSDYTVHSETGVDLALLRSNLKLTATERWEQNARALELVEAFREAGCVRRQRDVAKAERSQG